MVKFMRIEVLLFQFTVPIWITSGFIFYKYTRSKYLSIPAFLFAFIPVMSALSYIFHQLESFMAAAIFTILAASFSWIGELILFCYIMSQLGLKGVKSRYAGIAALAPVIATWILFSILLSAGIKAGSESILMIEGFAYGMPVSLAFLIFAASTRLVSERAQGAFFWRLINLWSLFMVLMLSTIVIAHILVLHYAMSEFVFLAATAVLLAYTTSLLYMYSSFEYKKIIEIIQSVL